MADEQDTDLESNEPEVADPEAAQGGAPEEANEGEELESLEGESGGGRGKWIALAAAVVVLLAAGGAGFVYFDVGFGGSDEPEGPTEYYALSDDDVEVDPEPELPTGARDGVDLERELGVEYEIAAPDVAAESEEDEDSAAEHMGKVFKLEPFVVNITDRDRDRFLKLKTEIELSDSKVSGEMEQRLPQIRDLIISLLGSKSFEEVRTIEGKNFLREEMLLRINALLVSGKAKRIFFTEFVVQ